MRKSRRPTATARRYGAAVAAFAGAWILDSDLNWRMAIIIPLVLNGLWAVVNLTCVPNRPQDVNIETEESREQEAAALFEEHCGLLEDASAAEHSAMSLRLAAAGTSAPPGGSISAPPGGSMSEDLVEAEEAGEALRLQLAANRRRLAALMAELPSRVVSVERLTIVRLTLQNQAMRVQKLEGELQMQTLRRGLQGVLGVGTATGTPTGTPTGAPNSAAAAPLPARQLRQLEHLLGLSVVESRAGGDELLALAGGDPSESGWSRYAAGPPPRTPQSPPSEAAARAMASLQHSSPHLSLAAVVPALIAGALSTLEPQTVAHSSTFEPQTVAHSPLLLTCAFPHRRREWWLRGLASQREYGQS